MGPADIRPPIETPASGASPSWQYAALVPALCLSMATFLVPAPPFADWPVHMALATVRAEYAASPELQAYYRLLPNVGPSSLFHLLASASGRPTMAAPILLAAALLGTVGAILLLARRFRTGPAFPLVGGLFTIHFSVIYGFMEFVIGVPLLLLSIWMLSIAPKDRPTRLVAWGVLYAALLATTFYAHFLLSIFAVGVAIVFGVLVSRRERAVAIAAVTATLPATIWLLAWKASRATDPSGLAWLRSYYGRRYLPQLRCGPRTSSCSTTAG